MTVIENTHLQELLKSLSVKRGSQNYGFELEFTRGFLTGRALNDYSFKTISVPATGDDPWKVTFDTLPDLKVTRKGDTQIEVDNVVTFTNLANGNVSIFNTVDMGTGMDRVIDRFRDLTSEQLFSLDPVKLINLLKGMEAPTSVSHGGGFEPIIFEDGKTKAYLMPMRTEED